MIVSTPNATKTRVVVYVGVLLLRRRRRRQRRRRRKEFKRMRQKEALEGDQNLSTTTYLCSFCF
jgi:hypothetical protein